MNGYGNKMERVLGIYTKLMNGSIIHKTEEADNYGVHQRSIQRDIDDIRNFFEEEMQRIGVSNSVIYDYNAAGYKLAQKQELKLSNSEILAVCKILLDSRAFTKQKMESILDKIVDCCASDTNRKLVKELLGNEKFHYIEPNHGIDCLDFMWQLAQAIQKNRYIEIKYHRLKEDALVERKLMPVAIMFSEYYFYLTAFIDNEETRSHFDVINDSFPTIYRIDRIQEMVVLDEKFHIPYKDRFEEGEFRKRVQFMFGGKLQKVRFRYSGLSLEAVLDRLPTARIINEENGVYTISAEVFGKGIDMWLKSQGDAVEIIEWKNG